MSIPNINLKELVEAGVHFGHKSQRWNPKCQNTFTVQERMFILSI